MRVALVYRNFNLGGSLERDSVFLARSLVEQGIDLHCYNNPETRGVELPGVSFHDVKPLTRSASRLGYPLETGSFALAATRALRRDRGKYDLVHVLGIAGWEHDVVTVHGVVEADQRRWPTQAGRDYRSARARSLLAPILRPQVAVGRMIQRLQLRRGRFQRVIAVTEAVRQDLVRDHGVPAEKIDVIPPPVDLERCVPAKGVGVRHALGLRGGEFILLFVGHAFERKGLADAVAALSGLPSIVHLVVVGKGDAGFFKRQAESLGVAERVHFVGGSERPESFYGESDAFVLPTRHDPWGMTLIEAMATGLPVVATEVAGAASIVESARAGLIVPERSPHDLREAVYALLRDPALRRAMSENGREAARRFGTEARGRAVNRIYEELLAREGPSWPTPRMREAVAG